MVTAGLNSSVGGRPGFASTQWGLLLAAASTSEGGEAAAEAARRTAWEDLYRTYSYPVYAFIRRRGRPRADAQDLTQDFFVHLLEKETLRRADPAKGRFRTFLLAALEYFLIDTARRETARKRGGDSQFLFLDDPETAENEYQLAAPAWETPERLFEARWAGALIDLAFARLQEEMAATGRSRHFEVLRDYVAGTEDTSYQEKAALLGLSLSALKSAIHRMRSRFGLLLRLEVARTVAAPEEVESEVRHLLVAIRTR